MGETMNASDLMKRPFSDLTISEQAAVLKARYDEETSEPGSQKIKTRGTIGEEYGLSGSSVGRLLKMNDLIDPLKDMMDRGSLYTKVALQLPSPMSFIRRQWIFWKAGVWIRLSIRWSMA